jgi:hypothetical protein
MPCTTKIDHSKTAEAMPGGLIAREGYWLIGGGLFQFVEDAPRARGHQAIVRNVLADSEHTDPEHVWGDEGPVNDQ